MARVIAWDVVTLDGYFEGARPWDLDFHGKAWGPDLERLSIEFGTTTSLLVFGRATYEGMKAYWTTTEGDTEVKGYMNALPKLVASRTITASDWNNTQVTADIEGEIRRRRQAPGKPIRIFGSAVLTDSLLKAGLIDEVMLGLVPVLLGEGTRFFKDGTRGDFRLLETRPLANGTIILRYAPEAATDPD